jgi:hypothetical protein
LYAIFIPLSIFPQCMEGLHGNGHDSGSMSTGSSHVCPESVVMHFLSGPHGLSYGFSHVNEHSLPFNGFPIYPFYVK